LLIWIFFFEINLCCCTISRTFWIIIDLFSVFIDFLRFLYLGFILIENYRFTFLLYYDFRWILNYWFRLWLYVFVSIEIRRRIHFLFLRRFNCWRDCRYLCSIVNSIAINYWLSSNRSILHLWFLLILFILIQISCRIRLF